MSRFVSAAVAAVAAISLIACSDAPLSPSVNSAQPGDLSFAKVTGPDGDAIVAGEIIVKLKGNADADAVSKKHDVLKGEKGEGDAFIVMITGSGKEKAKAKELADDPDVEYAEPNYLRQPTVDPKLWAFYNPGGLRMSYTSGGTGFIPAQYTSILDSDEDSPDNYAAGGAPVVVGSIDTGVDFSHSEFLPGQLIAGEDWISKKPNALPNDGDGHGTHTTGTMVGRTVGLAGVSGAGINVKVYVQRVCGNQGCPTTAIVNAIRAAADYPGMVAMNMSLGGSSISQAERDAIAYANSKNVLVIASAGNSGAGTVACPACDPGAISVASTNWRDAKASYSQYGSGLDISAPGGECYSNTTPEGCIYSSYKGGGYAWLQGTSMAAPQVTGTAGIVASKTGLRGAALRSQILGTVDDIGSPGYDTTFGAGRLNSYRAVTSSSLPAGK
jgi:subtilisin family serine protease